MRGLVILLVITCSFSLQAANTENVIFHKDFEKLKAAVDKRDLKELQDLLKDPNFDPNIDRWEGIISDRKGGTILHYLMRDGEFLSDTPRIFMAFLDALLDSGIDVNAVDMWGMVPLHYAARVLGIYHVGWMPVTRLLSRPEIKPNIKIPGVQEAAVHIAARHATAPGFVQTFLNFSEVHVNEENKVGKTPIMIAAVSSKSPNIIDEVVRHDRVNLEVKDRWGNTVARLVWMNTGLPPNADKGLMELILQERERKNKLVQGCYAGS